MKRAVALCAARFALRPPLLRRQRGSRASMSGAPEEAGMQGKIALEEHFAIAETLMESKPFVPADHWPELEHRLTDIQDRRLRLMDQHGIEMMLLSLNAPTVQAVTDTQRAVEMAQRANDVLAEEVAKRPQRFQGLAALPLQDPELAIRE